MDNITFYHHFLKVKVMADLIGDKVPGCFGRIFSRDPRAVYHVL